MVNRLDRLQNKNWKLPIFYLLVATIWIGSDLFPAEGWALGGADMRGLFYPWWEFVRNSLFKSQIPFWDPRHFAGTPFLHNPQIAFFYPPSWFVFLMPINRGISVYYLFHLSMAGWGMARFVQLLGQEQKLEEAQPAVFGASLGAVAAGLVFMLSGFFATRIFAGHVGFLATHIWLPWVLAATMRGIGTKKWQEAIPTAIFFALAILAGHTTTLLYLGAIWGLFILWQSWTLSSQSFKSGLYFLSISAFFATLLASVQLIPTFQLILRSGRLSQGGYEFATRFSLPWRQLITLIISEWFGEPTHIGYWGMENFEELSSYPGIFAAVSLIVALGMYWHNRTQRSLQFFALLAILGILISVGSNGFLYRWLYLLLPPFRVMRAPGRALFFVAFSAPVLLGLLIGHLFKQSSDGRRRLTWTIVLSALIWVGLVAFLYLGWSSGQTQEVIGRRWHQLQNVGRSGVILLLGLLLVRWLVSIKQHGQQSNLMWMGSIGLLLLLAADLSSFGQKLIRTEPMTPSNLWVEAVAAPEINTGRILPWGINIFEQNGAGQVGLLSIFGYNTLENGAITRLAASDPDPRSKAYDVLGVTHVVAESGLEQFSDGERGLKLIDQLNTTRVYARPTALDYARLVNRYEAVPDVGEQIDRLHSDDFDPSSSVLLNEDPNCDLMFSGENLAGSVEIVKRGGGALSLQVAQSQPSLLVVSEANFPGWEVLVDGEPQPIEQAYTALQAVCLPAGEHLVEFYFRPKIFIWSGAISLFSLCALCFLWWKNKKAFARL